ncbi:MAG: S9 family peptidase [Chloroflexi bacterium]|nr:MAG: S9 family peptidase [Chloroflexota bacterium]
MVALKRRGVRPEDFYLVSNVSDPKMAPDGSRVAYVVTRPDKEANEMRTSVWVVPADGSSLARQFSRGNKDHSPRWSPDGRYLAFVSERGEKNQLFVASLEGGEAKQVTKAEHGVSQPAWSPDGRRLAYTARIGAYKDPKDRDDLEKAQPRVIRDLIYKLDGVGFFDDRRSHIFTMEVERGQETQVTDGDWNDDHAAWSPDGKQIAFVSDREKDRRQRQWRTDLWIVPAEGGRTRKLTRSRGSCAHPAFSPDGRYVAFVGHEHGDEGLSRNPQLMIVPAEGGAAPITVSAEIDRPVAGWPVFMSGRTFAWADSTSLLFLAADRGRQSLYRAEISGQRVAMLLDGERQIEAFAIAPDGQQAVFTAVWLTEPVELYRASLSKNGRETCLSHANDEFRRVAEMGRLERFSYESVDGMGMEAFVLYPPDHRSDEKYPLATNVHGVPHSFHPGSRSWLEFQSLSAQGHVVLLPNPRGSTSYGEAFSRACLTDWGGKDYEDVIAGVEALVSKGIADSERLYIGGYSYGGFMASWAVGHTDRFRAAVVGAPVSNQVSMFGTGDIPQFDILELGGIPQQDAAEYAFRSPVTYLGNVNTPVLLLHHEGDLRCPVGQSEEIFQALKVMGKEVEFVRYPGGFHTYNTHLPSQTVDRTRRIVEWYDSHRPRRVAPAAPKKRHGKQKARAGAG